jgi:hypothetical protein
VKVLHFGFVGAVFFGLSLHAHAVDIAKAKAAKEAASKFEDAADAAEDIAQGQYPNTYYWADRLGDLLNDLQDELEDVIDGNTASLNDARDKFRDVHGAYMNMRYFAKNIPNGADRRKVLRNSLSAYTRLHNAMQQAGAYAAFAPGTVDELAPPDATPDDSNE